MTSTDPLIDLAKSLGIMHEVKPRRYIENYLDTLGEKIYYRAECSCTWHGKLRDGKMAKASAGKDASKHRNGKESVNATTE